MALESKSGLEQTWTIARRRAKGTPQGVCEVMAELEGGFVGWERHGFGGGQWHQM